MNLERFAPSTELHALLLPLTSTALLAGLAFAQDFSPIARLNSMLTFPVLVLGAWPGLVSIGHVADAIGAPNSPEVRERILDDRFIGSFGVCAIALSMLVQLAASLGTQWLSDSLAAAPLSSSLQGILCARATGARSPLTRGAALVVLLLLTLLLASVLAAPLAFGLSAVFSLGTAWALRRHTRHGVSVAAVAAGHASLLTILLVEHL